MKRLAFIMLLTAMINPHAQAAPQEPAGLAAQLRPPAGETLAFVMAARGVQIYTCARKENAEAWTFVAPEAVLTEDGKPAGKHYAGPYWESPDGSRVKGALRQRQDGGAGNIPWLLLAGAAEGSGKFAGVTSILRVATKGGVDPGACIGKAGEQLRVPYTADYYFYKKG